MKLSEEEIMIYGIALTIGIIGVIASRILYGLYDITLAGSLDNNMQGGLALVLDVLGTVLVVWAVINGF